MSKLKVNKLESTNKKPLEIVGDIVFNGNVTITGNISGSSINNVTIISSTTIVNNTIINNVDLPLTTSLGENSFKQKGDFGFDSLGKGSSFFGDYNNANGDYSNNFGSYNITGAKEYDFFKIPDTNYLLVLGNGSHSDFAIGNPGQIQLPVVCTGYTIVNTVRSYIRSSKPYMNDCFQFKITYNRNPSTLPIIPISYTDCETNSVRTTTNFSRPICSKTAPIYTIPPQYSAYTDLINSAFTITLTGKCCESIITTSAITVTTKNISTTANTTTLVPISGCTNYIIKTNLTGRTLSYINCSGNSVTMTITSPNAFNICASKRPNLSGVGDFGEPNGLCQTSVNSIVCTSHTINERTIVITTACSISNLSLTGDCVTYRFSEASSTLSGDCSVLLLAQGVTWGHDQIFSYDTTTNSTQLKFNTPYPAIYTNPGILFISNAIAHTRNKFWIYDISEPHFIPMLYDYDINSWSPFTCTLRATYNLSAGTYGNAFMLFAVDDTTLYTMDASFGNGPPFVLLKITLDPTYVNPPTISAVTTVSNAPYINLHGDLIITTDNKLIYTYHKGNLPNGGQPTYIAQFNLTTNVEELVLDITNNVGGICQNNIFVKDGVLYLTKSRFPGQGFYQVPVYTIDPNPPYTVTQVNTIGWPLINVWDCSNLYECSNFNFNLSATTATTIYNDIFWTDCDGNIKSEKLKGYKDVCAIKNTAYATSGITVTQISNSCRVLTGSTIYSPTVKTIDGVYKFNNTYNYNATAFDGKNKSYFEILSITKGTTDSNGHINLLELYNLPENMDYVLLEINPDVPSNIDSGKIVSNYFGKNASAQGFNTQAKGIASKSEGNNTLADGQASHAEGFMTNASGKASHAGGINAKATHTGEFARSSGMFNSIGDAQYSIITAFGKLIGTDVSYLYVNGTDENVKIEKNSMVTVELELVGIVSEDTNNSMMVGKGFVFKGISYMIKNNADGELTITSLGTNRFVQGYESGVGSYDINLVTGDVFDEYSEIKISVAGTEESLTSNCLLKINITQIKI